MPRVFRMLNFLLLGALLLAGTGFCDESEDMDEQEINFIDEVFDRALDDTGNVDDTGDEDDEEEDEESEERTKHFAKKKVWRYWKRYKQEPLYQPADNWTDPAGNNTAGNAFHQLQPIKLDEPEFDWKEDKRIRPEDCEQACEVNEDCHYWNFFFCVRPKGRKCELMRLQPVLKQRWYSGFFLDLYNMEVELPSRR